MASSEWQLMQTADGHSYYYNAATDTTSTTLPSTGAGASASLGSAPSHVWVPCEREGYIAASVTSGPEPPLTFASLDGGPVRLPKSLRKAGLDAFIPLDPATLDTTRDDLVQMGAIDEGIILHNLRKRFFADEIYTNIGPILIVVNPYRWLKLYSKEIMDSVAARNVTDATKPHIFNIADDAFRALSEGIASGGDGANQSILISGESGAGKTEATKQALKYLAYSAGSGGEDGVEQKLLAANPLLEAFGNAATLRNHNSSRFGKWMEVFFDTRRSIVGARINNYLLEKSRVSHQIDGERNFHIFYHLTKDPGMSRAFNLGAPEDYVFINKRITIDDPHFSDAKDFAEVLHAMDLFNITDDNGDRTAVFRIVAAILHFGNIKFAKDPSMDEGGSRILNPETLELAADLLSVSGAALSDTLLYRTLVVRGQADVRVPLSPAAAADNRNALARTIYNCLFNWLVARVNQVLAPAAPTSSLYLIGILDIFGFEIFENNSFEQLCINFANEKLQQHFNQHTFKMEQALYMAEGVPFDEIKFIDNQPCLDLLEHKPHGILIMLDEELLAPSGSDMRFLDKANSRHAKADDPASARYSTAFKTPHTFNINHYAGQVTYDVRGFLEKNKDTIELDLLNLVHGSSDPFITALFDTAVNASSKSRKHSVAHQFRAQLNSLMSNLQATTPHYVRCIKPNSVFTPQVFDGHESLLQLRYSGVFEAVRIRQTGYPFRYRHEEFVRRYGVFNGFSSAGSPKATCKAILAAVKGDFSAVQLGRTRVLYRAPQHHALEVRLSIITNRMATRVQAAFRGFRARRLYARMKEVAADLRAAMATLDVDTLKAAVDRARSLWFQLALTDEAERVCNRLLEERSLNARMETLVAAGDPEGNYEAILAVTTRARELGVINPHIDMLAASIASIHERKVALANLVRGTAEYDRAALEEGLAAVQRLGLALPPGTLEAAMAALDQVQAEKAFVASASSALSAAQDDVTSLRLALEKGRAMALRTPAAKRLMARLEAVLAVRVALTDRDWAGLEAAVAAARAMGLADVPDVVAAVEGLALRTKMAAVAVRLGPAAASKNLASLQTVLDEASALDMARSLYSDWSSEVRAAQEQAVRHASLLAALGEYTLASSAKVIGPLEATVQAATRFGFLVATDVALLGVAEVLVDLRRGLRDRDFDALAKDVVPRARGVSDLWGTHAEVINVVAGLELRGAMAAHAAVLAAAVEARDAHVLEQALRVADAGDPLEMSTSMWSTWQGEVADAAAHLAKHRAVVGELAGCAEAVPDPSVFEASVPCAPAMEAACRAADRFGLKTDDDVALRSFVEALCGLRIALRDRDWRNLQVGVSKASSVGYGEHGDVVYVRDGLALRSRMSGIAARLADATKRADAPGLVEALNAASAARMSSSYWSTWAETVEAAAARLDGHRATMRGLHVALGPGKSTHVGELEAAVEAAEAFGFGVPDDLAVVDSAGRVLCVRRALTGGDYDALEVVVGAAVRDRVVESHPELVEGRDIVDMRGRMALVVPRLEAGLDGRDAQALAAAIRDGRALDMDVSPHSSWRSEMQTAKTGLAQHRRIMARLRTASSDAAGLHIDALAEAISQAEAWGLRVFHETETLERARVALRIRQARSRENWDELRAGLDAALVAQLDNKETRRMRQGLAKMERIDKLAYKMGSAMDVRHLDIVRMCLTIAEEEDMEWSEWSRWRDMVPDARDVAERYAKVRGELEATLTVTQVKAGCTAEYLAAHEAALDRAAEFGLELKEDVDLFASSKILFFVRDAWARRDFVALEQHLKTALAFGLSSDELGVAAQELHGFAQAAGLASLLESAMDDTRNYTRGTLRLALEQARGSGMEDVPEYAEVYARAVKRQAEIDGIDAAIASGAEAMDLGELQSAVRRAEAIGYERAEHVQRAAALAGELDNALSEARLGVAEGDPLIIKVAVRKLKALGVSGEVVEEFETAIAVKEYTDSPFVLTNYSGLRSGKDYASPLWFGRKAAAAGMLSFSTKSLPNSLLVLGESGEVKTAVSAFDSLLALCGLQASARRGQSSGSDLVHLGASANGTRLASELYLHCIKQLEQSGSPQADAIIWRVLAAYAGAFLPSEDFYPFLEWWLRCARPAPGSDIKPLDVRRELRARMQAAAGGAAASSQ